MVDPLMTNTGMWQRGMEHAEQAERLLAEAKDVVSPDFARRCCDLAAAEAALASMWCDLAIKDGQA